jgi:putative heme-binding domain-containing protein
MVVAAALAVAALLPASPLLARGQGHETAFDVEDGGRAFRTSCQGCHGPDGDEIPGIDLGRGQFKRAASDADLVRIIRTGIPGTPMPPVNVSDEQALRIVAYLRSVAASKRSTSAAGNAARGKQLFEGKGGCVRCHRVAGSGGRLGPELTTIGQVRRAVELERSLVDPDAEVLPTNRFYRVVTGEGTTVAGRLLNHDTFTVQILDERDQLRSFAKTDLREYRVVASPMPSVRGMLDAQEVMDLVSYLVSLKKRSTP